MGLLAMMTAPLASGLFVYHVYLIWAGMTTNESSKWADWRDEIDDGLVFRTERDLDGKNDGGGRRDESIEPRVEWPISSSQQLVRREGGRSPDSQVHFREDFGPSDPHNDARRSPQWKRVRGLDEVGNLYDLGFWDNLIDVWPT